MGPLHGPHECHACMRAAGQSHALMPLLPYFHPRGDMQAIREQLQAARRESQDASSGMGTLEERLRCGALRGVPIVVGAAGPASVGHGPSSSAMGWCLLHAHVKQ